MTQGVGSSGSCMQKVDLASISGLSMIQVLHKSQDQD